MFDFIEDTQMIFLSDFCPVFLLAQKFHWKKYKRSFIQIREFFFPLGVNFPEKMLIIPQFAVIYKA